jgi:preprotein translocase subunit SecD
MELKPLLKEWRIWVLLVALAGATVALGPHYEQGQNGQVSLATEINQGLELQGGTRVLLDVQGEDLNETDVENVAGILETRVSAFGLTQTDIRTVRLEDEFKIQVSVADTNRSRLTDLLSQEGSFEARMPLTVSDSRSFNLTGDYVFERQGSGIEVDGQSYQTGETFELDGTKFYYTNNTNGAANLEVVMYDGEDVQNVLRSGRGTGVRQTGSGAYQFQFPVVISQDAAENVRRVAENYETVILQGSQGYLGENGQAAQLRLYVDDNLQSSLNIAAEFKTQTIAQPSISGSENTAEGAREEMKRLQSILESGSLPYPVEIDSISTITSSLGGQFLSAAFISIVASLIAVGVLVFFRYGDPRVAVPIVITGSSEVYILMGAWFSTLATLDLASIAGIIAAVGTGVDDQIIITDESGRERIRSWKKRMKRAFFVIFTSAASTVGAMMPIVSPEISTLGVMLAGLGLIGYTLQGRRNPHYFAIGGLAAAIGAVAWTLSPSAFALQAVKGFAVTTILGIMVGIVITRPAYAKILEHLKD